jgi:S-(hydroxymethyl)glutathione dehydrogenase/alcohol dehydrogenase
MKMKAAVVTQLDGTFHIEDVEIADPIGAEVLVRVKASGLCHSDLHLAETDFGIPLPAVFGHELAGIVEQIGPDVTDFALGDHVVASLIQFCGHCFPCHDGRTYQCNHPEETVRSSEQAPRLRRQDAPLTQVFGTGGFAELTIVHQNQLVAVPKAMPFPQAALLACGTVTGAGAVLNTAQVKAGQSIAVIGIGGVGLNVISGAILAAAGRIIAIDNQPEKEALARKFGATDFINPDDGDPVEAVKELVPGGVDHAFEVIGLKSTAEMSIKMLRTGGTAYMIGAHKPGSAIDLNVQDDLVGLQKSVRGVYMGSSNFKHDVPMYADLYLRGQLNLDDLLSREIDISQINEAYEELSDGKIARSVITSFN